MQEMQLQELRNLDPKVNKERNLIAYFYNIDILKEKHLTTHMEMLKFIRSNRLPVFDYAKECNSTEDVINEIENRKERHNLDILTDGAVIK